MLLAAASGGRVLTESLTPRHTLYLALEDSDRRLQSRMRYLGHGASTGELLRQWDYATTLEPGQSPIDLVADWLDSLPSELDAPPLVTIDTLGRTRGPRIVGESPYDADYRLGASLHGLARSVEGLGVVAVHHDRKAISSDFVDSVSGTNGLAGSADTVIVLRRDREAADGVILVTGRDVVEASYGIAFDAGRWSLLGESWEEARSRAAEISASTGRGDIARQAVKWLHENGSGTPKVIAKSISASYDATKKALHRLYDSGEVGRDQGRYFLPGGRAESALEGGVE